MSRTSTPFRTWALGAVFLASLGGCSGPEEAPDSVEPLGQVKAAVLSTRVVGYLPTWAGDVNTLQYSKLSHINYAFALPTASGGLTGVSSSDARLRSLVTQAHAQGVKVLIAVGGWNDGNDSGFEQMAANATSRTAFVNNVVNFVNAAGLDGVDIDWEYPDPGASGNNYALLMNQLGTAMHSRGKLLTAAVVANGYTGGGVPASVFNDVDFLNIMAYDGGQPHSTYDLAVQSLNYWKGRGLPASKAVLGVPFYGRSPSSYVGYSELVARDSQAPYKDNVGDVYYNGIATIQAKTQLGRQNGGVMIWELSQDTSGSTSLLNAIYSVAQGTGGGTGAYRLVNKASGRCVDINGPSTADGASIHQWACHTGTSQQWSMEATDSGYYRFVSRYSGKALDVRDVSTADGAKLQQWSYSSGSNQQFKPVDLGNGYFRLEARHSGKVLDVTGCLQGSGDGTLLQQWTWSNNDCQQFRLEAL
ncbi:chitinase [Corallococcus sp. AB049A]|uniref:chitinase n=1 Tax=Corallococcus interemptor TaxID=2316720 RepID=A0A3A8QTT6_9BACT|nr:MULTISPECIES: RICIN domain-containing protein [Corallococcus]RKH49364.1 chitinase [Corallococcus sp. AB050B]RKH72156.1 chitinase [Corallococcus interemptor]RKI65435.1 chitinase [Corallococcus sp. AB049A]